MFVNSQMPLILTAFCAYVWQNPELFKFYAKKLAVFCITFKKADFHDFT